jgi:hypothetical protein
VSKKERAKTNANLMVNLSAVASARQDKIRLQDNIGGNSSMAIRFRDSGQNAETWAKLALDSTVPSLVFSLWRS